jgi:hypothetical protein
MEKINENDINSNPIQDIKSCKICGDRKACMAYGVLTCDSCKIFFRRNYQFDLVRI